MGAELQVDGPRPAVEWVASLPSNWTNEGERLVLLILACDAFDNVSAPGSDNLAQWCGMHRSSVMGILSRLSASTAHRPALVEPMRSKGRNRTRYRLRVELSGETKQLNCPVMPDGSGAQLSGDAGLLITREPSGDAGRLERPTVAQLSGELSGDAGHALALPQVVDPPVVRGLQEGASDTGGRDNDVRQTLDLLARFAGITAASSGQAVREQLTRGWTPHQIAEHVRRAGTLNGVHSPAAVVRTRVEQLGPPPPVLPPKCPDCDPNRMVETDDGRPTYCPTCHPKRVAS